MSRRRADPLDLDPCPDLDRRPDLNLDLYRSRSGSRSSQRSQPTKFRGQRDQPRSLQRLDHRAVLLVAGRTRRDHPSQFGHNLRVPSRRDDQFKNARGPLHGEQMRFSGVILQVGDDRPQPLDVQPVDFHSSLQMHNERSKSRACSNLRLRNFRVVVTNGLPGMPRHAMFG